MKIDVDGLMKQSFNMEVKPEMTGGGIEAESQMKSVLWGHSMDSILGREMSKSSILDDAGGTVEALKSQAAALKGSLSAIFNKMDTGSVVRMDEDGVDINNTETDELVTVVEQIQIKLAMYCDDFQATASIDTEDVIRTMGAGAAAYKIARSLHQNSVKPTKENVSQVLGALEKSEQIGNIGDGEKAFIIQNNMRPTINNVYVASNSGYVSRTGTISESQWNELKPQVEKVIENSGRMLSDENIQTGKWMIENDIDVTTDNFDKLERLDEINELLGSDRLTDRITAAMADGLKAGDTLLTGEEYSWEKAAKAVNTVNTSTGEQIMAWVHSGRPYTIEGLSDTMLSGDKKIPENTDREYIKATRELYQIKLLMTVEAASVMEKNGVSVNTTELSELIEELRRTEAAVLGEKTQFNEVTLGDVDSVNEILEAYDRLRSVPSAVVGAVIKENSEPTAMAMLIRQVAVTARMAEAGEAYEALSTEIRSDLGDSVSKAVKASTGDILSGMGYEDNEANRRAVRILAYNAMEINEKNIDSVKSVDYSVNRLFKSMTPQAVLKMIRDGVNPLETDVTELNGYLTETWQNETVKVEKYSEFLYRLDKNNTITKDEREKFIGIYRLVTQFQKDGMRAAGVLVNQGMPLTMGNLLTAYMTEKDRGIELTADDDTELVRVDDKVTYYKNLFGEIQKKIIPDVLKNISEETDDMTPEQFAEKIRIGNVYDEDVVYGRYVENAGQAAHMPDQVYKFVTENGIPATYNNLFAVQRLLKKPADLFDTYRREEQGSDTGESIIDVLDDREAVRKKYDEMLGDAREIVNKALDTENSSIRMEELKNFGNGINLLAGLAHRNNYYIPYGNDDQTGIINLKVIEDNENKGSFSVRMYDERYGRVTVDARVEYDSVNAYVMCDSADGMKAIQEKIKNIKLQLASYHFTAVAVSVNMASAQPDYDSSVNENVSTRRIFQAAKIFVENLAK